MKMDFAFHQLKKPEFRYLQLKISKFKMMLQNKI